MTEFHEGKMGTQRPRTAVEKGPGRHVVGGGGSMRRALLISGILVLGGVLCGCGDSPEDPDGSTLMDGSTSDDGGSDAGSDGGGARCERNADCDDGTFCNGEETCEPGTDGANALGCVAGTPPCDGMNCDETADECTTNCDIDGDSREAEACGGDDCDDNDARRFPGNTESCDIEGIDEDCVLSTIAGAEGDVDEDGYFDSRCFNRDGADEVRGTDCNDSVPTINPDGVEACDSFDNDCDGEVDEGVLGTFYQDEDGDSFGVTATSMEACVQPSGYAAVGGDCNDTPVSGAPINPAAVESCDGVNNDCDASVDEGVLVTYYRDRDSDGFGDSSDSVAACTSPVGYVGASGDCDDDPVGGGAVYPDAAEVCDAVDNDCDTDVDEEASDIGTRRHCGSCGDVCQFGCQAGLCDAAVEITVDEQSACALTESGRVFCWGGNAAGSLGAAPSTVLRGVAEEVVLPPGALVASIDNYRGTTCVSSGGSGRRGGVVCWGRNPHGQVGDGTQTNRYEARQAGPEQNWRAHSVGENSSCAIYEPGQLSCWGRYLPIFASSGSWSLETHLNPVYVPSISGVQEVSMNSGGGCYLASGVVRCFGTNGTGQAGAGVTDFFVPEPAEVTLPMPATHIQDTCAVAGGDVYCWGNDRLGLVGDGPGSFELCDASPAPIPCARSPQLVFDTGIVSELFFARNTRCLRTESGETYCWGDMRAGTVPGLAEGTYEEPTRAPLLDRYSRLSVDLRAGCGIDGGEVYCWGPHPLAGHWESGPALVRGPGDPD